METVAHTLTRYDSVHERDYTGHPALYSLLANERRRTIVSIVDDEATPVSPDCLATLLAERETGDSTAAPPDALVRELETAVHHVHLPSLEDAGIVDLNSEGAVELTDHAIWTDSAFRTLLDSQDVADTETISRTLELLASSERRAILAALRKHESLYRDVLASTVADVLDATRDVEALDVSIRHCHLPKLVEADVVERVDSGSRVRYAGNEFLEDWWFPDGADA